MAKEADGSRRLVLPAGSLREGALELPEALAHYARAVLRLRLGDRLYLLDGAGVTAQAEVQALGRRGLRLEVQPPTRTPRPPGPVITLNQAVSKADKLQDVLRRATALGVSALRPVYTDRGARPPRAAPEQNAPDRGARWAAVIDDALRVSGRRHRPQLHPPCSLAALAEQPRAPLALALAGQGAASLAAALPAAAPAAIELLIGPEGGLSPSEQAQLQAAGFQLAHLGPHTLRTEDAGPAALAILGHVYGALYR